MDLCLKENEVNGKVLEQISEGIKKGKIIAFPTETVYGVGGSGLNENSVKKLFEIKNRPLDKPISLLVSNLEMINLIAKDISNIERKIIEKFFPGPLTIVLKKKECVPNILTANTEFVGVRMPENEIALKIINSCEMPLAVTSANISGMEADTSFKKVYKDFENKVDFFIDGGESKLGISSTVIQVVDNDIKVLREGIIKKEDILKII